MEELLDNPKTMDGAHVARAMKIRNIFNFEDMQIMAGLTIAILALILSAAGWLVYREIRLRNKKKVVAQIALIIAFVLLLFASVSLVNDYLNVFKDVPAKSPHQWGLQRWFYLCDGIIIMLAYWINMSYESANILVFAILQPLLILLLALLIVWYQSRLKVEKRLYNK